MALRVFMNTSYPIPSLRVNAKTQSYTSFKKTQLALAISTLVAGLGGVVAPAFAGPEGGVVTGGSGSINQAGNTTTINQTSDRMAIDWNSFDVAADERVQFSFSLPHGAVLN